ncbi:hypothetical protein [Pseudomonas sp. NFX98]|uniref:hypothetical protein n=1 Tax=Pseudomonas sp. NFX98 TaxID=3399122 RepID=UPI0039FDAAED
MAEDIDEAFDYAAQWEYFGLAKVLRPMTHMASMKMASEKSDKESAAVLGSTIAAYDERLSGDDREAFDDTLLYAEIRADKFFNRETQRREWYGEYSTALTNCGWPTMSDPYREYISGELDFTMDEAALQIIALAAGADKLKVLPLISNAFNSLEKNEGAVKLIELKRKRNRAGNFQVAPCVLLDGRPTMIACALQMETRELITKMLFFKYRGEEVKVYSAATRRTLNRRAYNVVKDFIRAAADKARLEYFKVRL